MVFLPVKSELLCWGFCGEECFQLAWSHCSWLTQGMLAVPGCRTVFCSPDGDISQWVTARHAGSELSVCWRVSCSAVSYIFCYVFVFKVCFLSKDNLWRIGNILPTSYVTWNQGLVCLLSSQPHGFQPHMPLFFLVTPLMVQMSGTEMHCL